jgi:glyceraldehyde 3-phosphate dehydrogenase
MRSCADPSRRSTARRDSKWRPELRSTGSGGSGRLVARAILAKQDSGARACRHQRPGRCRVQRAAVKRDSVHGAYPGEVRQRATTSSSDGRRISRHGRTGSRQAPPWRHRRRHRADCTGFSRTGIKGRRASHGRPKRSLIRLPAKGVDLTVVYGVNHD